MAWDIVFGCIEPTYLARPTSYLSVRRRQFSFMDVFGISIKK